MRMRVNGKPRRQLTPVDRQQTEGDGDDRLPREFGPGAKAERALLGDLGPVVDESEHAAAERRDEHEKRQAIRHAHRQEDERDHNEDEHAAHRGSALLDEVALRAVGAHLLPDVADAEQPDPQREQDRGKEERDRDGQEDLEGRVATEAKHGAPRYPPRLAPDPSPGTP